jgi:hypothetical protein
VKIASKSPQVTMLLKVMVERCPVKEFGNRCKGTGETTAGATNTYHFKRIVV